MTFWSSPALQPTRRRNFKVQLAGGGGYWWWVKTVSKPSFEVTTNEYQLVNHVLKYPGLVVWNDVTITMVDTGGKTKELLDAFKKSGYVYPDEGTQKGLAKNYGGSTSKHIIIEQYGASTTGTPIEKWKLANSFVKSISFGDLDYSSDDLVELQIIISYDWAELDGVSSSSASGSPSQQTDDSVPSNESTENNTPEDPRDNDTQLPRSDVSSEG